MGKKKTNSRPQQAQGFREVLADQTLKKFKPYIDQQMVGAAQAIMVQQANTLQKAFLRMRVLEELLVSKFEDVTMTSLANRIAELEDQHEGYTVSNEPIMLGNRVRLTALAYEADKDVKNQEGQKFLVDNIGSGDTLGKGIEEEILGMKVGDSKTITQTSEGSNILVDVFIDSVSSKSKKEATNDTNA